MPEGVTKLTLVDVDRIAVLDDPLLRNLQRTVEPVPQEITSPGRGTDLAREIQAAGAPGAGLGIPERIGRPAVLKAGCIPDGRL